MPANGEGYSPVQKRLNVLLDRVVTFSGVWKRSGERGGMRGKAGGGGGGPRAGTGGSIDLNVCHELVVGLVWMGDPILERVVVDGGNVPGCGTQL